MEPNYFYSVGTRVFAAALPVVVIACSASAPSDTSNLGRATVELKQIPASVACVRITATGSRTVVSDFNVATGAPSASYSLTGLPVGGVAFAGAAFSTSCTASTSVASATWISEPVTVTVSLTAVAAVALVMKRNGQANVSVDFQDDPDGGTGGTTSAGGASGTGGANNTGAAGTAGASGSGGTAACIQSACGSHKWACWKMPNPASLGLPNSANYVDLGNGIVRDGLTCLEWEKAPDTAVAYWTDNFNRCANLRIGGYADWRLPTRVEMASIVDVTSNPAVNTNVFPNPPAGYYRTGSDWYSTITGQSTSGYAWGYTGSTGIATDALAKTTTTAVVRCVRGNGSGEGQSVLAVEPPNHYTVSAGEVTDNYTGLVWQQANSATTMAWAASASYCSGLGLNGNTWRVPTINELASLVNEARVTPAVNTTAFPNTQYGTQSNNWYWSSNTYVGGGANWAINFSDGFTGYNAGASGAWNYFTAAWVKCVR